ncbi:MAG: C25 family cysteine peptidase, partial [Candidatus Eisenbacteria bacterium]|nr:C25 family cysteine peptidase [Candidatus Eisenbacteria bacterium]
MRLVLGVLTSVFLLSSIPALASTELLNPTAVGPDDLPTIRVVSSTESGLVLDFELPVLSVEELRAGERSFLSAAIPGGGLEGNPGQPAIPTFTRFLAIPDRAGVNVSARREGEVEVEGFPLVPMQEDDEQAGFAFDGAAYGRQGYGEEPAVSVGAPAISRELRLVPITFRPVRYDPSRQSLSVASTIRVEVSFQGSSEENVKTRHHRSIPPSFARMYQELVINHEQALRGLEVRPGSWILVCGSDTNLTSRLQPLVDWRMREGYKAVMVTTAQIGSTNSAIKSYIQEAYDTWEDPPEYVVIAGDAYGGYPVPTWFEDVSGYHGEGDHPYVQLEGNDVLADAHVGRLSFSSLTELETIVAKILGYERTPDTSDPGWFTRACLVGDPYDSGYSTVQVQQWIKIRLRQLGYAQIDTVFNSPFVSQMATAMNRGDTIFCYRGIQGMSGWSNTNTYNLTNGWKMPFVVTITCDTGSFYSTNSCRSEAFLRAGSATSPKAAIGAIGTATTGTHTRYNNCITYGIYYGLLYEGAYNLGAALTRGKMEMFLNYQLVDPNHVTIWSHWNNLMGDPAVPCWTAFPEPLQVTAPSSIPAGANSVTVTVRENGLPSEGAQVCLWKGTETHAVGVTDAQGIVEIPITTATPGDMLLTVTKHDRHAYEQTIPVVNQNRYVALAATALDDDARGERNGNGDAKIEPGETVELRVQLRNFGPQTANDVTAQLTCDDPRVQVIDDSETFGNIPGGGSAWCADDFDFRVDTICQDGVTLRFGIDVTSGSDHWHSMLELPVVSADLVWDGTIELSNVGGNAQMDPGETGQLAIRLVNQGGFPASSITAMLLSLSEFVDVPDGDGAFPAIPVDGNGMNSSCLLYTSDAADEFR